MANNDGQLTNGPRILLKKIKSKKEKIENKDEVENLSMSSRVDLEVELRKQNLFVYLFSFLLRRSLGKYYLYS